MLIDRVDAKILKETLADDAGIIFYIDEPFGSFSAPGSAFSDKTFAEVPLPQWLPYNKFTLHFSDGFLVFHLMDIPSVGFCIAIDSLSIDKTGRIGSVLDDRNLILLYDIDKNTLVLTKILTIDRFSMGEREVPSNEVSCQHCRSYYALWQFLSFLSCKNVETKEVSPGSRQQTARIKRGKRPLVKYHILILKSLSRKYIDGVDRKLWTNRVHLCRGHMREYTAENPLFGKVIGKFWIPPHARGRRENGVVKKDYRLGV